RTAAEGAPHRRRDRPVWRLLAQPLGRHQLGEQLLRRQGAVTELCKEIFGRLRAGIAYRRRERVAVLDRLRAVDVVAAQLLLEHAAPELDRARPLLHPDQVLDLVARVRADDEVQPVAARLVPGLGDDLDDIAVLEPGAQRHHLAVDARADAL